MITIDLPFGFLSIQLLYVNLPHNSTLNSLLNRCRTMADSRTLSKYTKIITIPSTTTKHVQDFVQKYLLKTKT